MLSNNSFQSSPTATTADTVSTTSNVMALDPSRRTRCEVWTRVMGYHRPVSSFNIGKKGEFNERKFFEERNATTPA